MIPGSGGTQRLVRLIGLARAKDMVLRGRRVGAEEALAWGLVTAVVPRAELDRATADLAAELAGAAPLALRMAKRVLDHAAEGDVGLHLEGLAYGLLRSLARLRRGRRGVHGEAQAGVRGALSVRPAARRRRPARRRSACRRTPPVD